MMRKAYILLCITAMTVGLQAQTLTSGKLKFVVTDPEQKEVELVRDNDTTVTSIVVPTTIQQKQGKKKAVTYRVTSIAPDVFRDKPHLTSVVLPDMIRVISDSMFMGCSSLTSITYSDSLEHVGKAAFSGCSSLRYKS